MVTVAGQMGTTLVDGQQLLLGEEAPECQCGINRRTSVALGADEEIPVLPVGIGGVYLHLPGIEYCQQIRNGQRSTQMTKAQMTQGLEGFDPDLCGKDSGLLLTSKFHNAHLQKVESLSRHLSLISIAQIHRDLLPSALRKSPVPAYGKRAVYPIRLSGPGKLPL